MSSSRRNERAVLAAPAARGQRTQAGAQPARCAATPLRGPDCHMASLRWFSERTKRGQVMGQRQCCTFTGKSPKLHVLLL